MRVALRKGMLSAAAREASGHLQCQCSVRTCVETHSGSLPSRASHTCQSLGYAFSSLRS